MVARYNKRDLKKALLKEYELKGRELTLREINSNPRLPSQLTILKCFNVSSLEKLWEKVLKSAPTSKATDRSKDVINWLIDHPLINIDLLCQNVGYEIKIDCEIPAEYLTTIETILKEYGYRLHKNFKNWSKKDIEYLKDNSGRKKQLEIAEALGRGFGAVSGKISKLKRSGIIIPGVPRDLSDDAPQITFVLDEPSGKYTAFYTDMPNLTAVAKDKKQARKMLKELRAYIKSTHQ